MEHECISLTLIYPRAKSEYDAVRPVRLVATIILCEYLRSVGLFADLGVAGEGLHRQTEAPDV